MYLGHTGVVLVLGGEDVGPRVGLQTQLLDDGLLWPEEAHRQDAQIAFHSLLGALFLNQFPSALKISYSIFRSNWKVFFSIN